MLSREWFTAAELAALGLPGLPASKSSMLELLTRATAASDFRRRERAGRGGGTEFHYSALPAPAQAAVVQRFNQVEATARRSRAEGAPGQAEIWAWFERLPEKKQADARRKLEALDALEAMTTARIPRTEAARLVASARGISVTSLYQWRAAVDAIPRADWLAFLAPRHAGRAGAEAECPDEAWEVLKADYLRLERPTFDACWRRLTAIAGEKGWELPSARTLQRRIAALPVQLVVLAREGTEALKRIYPAQERDRGVFHALEAVNADGHVWDVFVKWEDGHVSRPMMCAFQDLYSGMILAWRIDRTAHKDVVRLAFGDLVEKYGIPDHCFLDNGRDFASKWLTGGTPNRFRFKVRDDEPAGVMTVMGVQVHWTTPYHGQSKPIERAFRDFAGDVAKHPRFAGAWTGNTPMAKPENYASRAVPIEVFRTVVGAEIAAHNARTHRRTRVCGGELSFQAAFDASYGGAPIKRASGEQRRMWLMAAEALTVRGQDATVHLLGNRYWCQALLALRGQKVVARFDPERLHDGVWIYRMDGPFLAHAPVLEAAGFADADAARAHAAKLKRFVKATRELSEAEKRLSIAEVAAMTPLPKAPEPPEPKVVRLVAGNTALRAVPTPDEQSEDEERLLRAIRMNAAHRGLRVVGQETEADGWNPSAPGDVTPSTE